jgi:hypothetical protein
VVPLAAIKKVAFAIPGPLPTAFAIHKANIDSASPWPPPNDLHCSLAALHQPHMGSATPFATSIHAANQSAEDVLVVGSVVKA